MKMEVLKVVREAALIDLFTPIHEILCAENREE